MRIGEPILYHSSSVVKILSFLLIILLSLLFTLIIGIVFGFLFFGGEMMDYAKGSIVLTDPAYLPMLKYLQIVNTLGLFIIPPIIFAFLTSKKPAQYLALTHKPAIVSTLAGIAIIIVILPFLHWTAGINEMLRLPEWMSGIEEWMKRSEVQAKEITDMFLGTSTIAGLSVNMLMIAVLPAIGEELFFRGVLLRLFREWMSNVHMAVIISALLFSALHLQFYGFLPRFILGLFLGYIFVWTRSIWAPIIVHFINNGIAIFAAWLYAGGIIGTDAESLGDVDQPVVVISSLIMVLVMLGVILYYESKKKGSTIE